MIFSIYYRHYSCGDYGPWNSEIPEKFIINGAWKEVTTIQEYGKVQMIKKTSEKIIDGETYYHYETVESKEMPMFFGMSGYNHRIEDGQWVKDRDITMWYVDIFDMESLKELMLKFGGEIDWYEMEWSVEIV